MSVLDTFHPAVRAWFQRRFDAPIEAQALGWPEISSGRDTLIAAPTGSGKMLAPFLASIDRLLRRAEDGPLEAAIAAINEDVPAAAIASPRLTTVRPYPNMGDGHSYQRQRALEGG